MVDDFTFKVTLSEPVADFLNSVVVAMVSSIVSQDAVEANGGVEAGSPNEFMAGNMVGTGPYKFVVWNRNENIQLEVNDNYWGENAKLNVRVEIGGDPDVRVLGLRAGEFDTIETDPSFVADLEGADGVTIYTGGLLLEPLHIGFNLNIPEGSLPDGDTIPEDFFHDPRIEIVEIVCNNLKIRAHFRTPKSDAPVPAVLIMCGADVFKEDRGWAADLALENGMAALVMDAPGTGENEFPWAPESVVAWEAAIDFLMARKEVDASRVGAFGTTHPGGSITGYPGRNAAKVILSDIGIDPSNHMS